MIAAAYGADIPARALFVLTPPVILSLALPISLGGWGVREAAMIAALGTIGVPADVALKISLMFGLLTNLVHLPALGIWFAYRHRAVCVCS